MWESTIKEWIRLKRTINNEPYNSIVLVRIKVETEHSMDSVFTPNITKEITNVLSLIISKDVLLSRDDSRCMQLFTKKINILPMQCMGHLNSILTKYFENYFA